MSAPPPNTPSLPAYLAQAAMREFLDHKALLIFFAIYMSGAKLVLFAVGETQIYTTADVQDAADMFFNYVPEYMALFLAAASLWVVARDRLASTPSESAGGVHAAPVRPALMRPIRILMRTIVFTIVFGLLLNTFAQVKSIIPVIAPFTWDDAFWQLDRFVHGGIDPWRYTWAVFGSGFATSLLDRLYGSWFLVVNLMPFAVLMFDADVRRRNRYLLAYFALWAFLGNGAAVLFSSVGPCFADQLGAVGHDLAQVYAPLMTQLTAVDESHALLALQFQAYLANSYNGVDQANFGISAMPSLHVAHAVLLCCLAWSYARLWGGLALAYAFVIQIGSVHLGWHYAIDGYIAAVGTLAIWWVAGKLVSATRKGLRQDDLNPARNEA